MNKTSKMIHELKKSLITKIWRRNRKKSKNKNTSVRFMGDTLMIAVSVFRYCGFLSSTPIRLR